MNQTKDEFKLDLKELLLILWKEKVLVSIVTLTLTVATVYYAISIPNTYKAEVLLAPVGESSGMGGLSGQLSGLAAIAGVNLSSGKGERLQLALETMTSRSFLGEFVARHDILVPLMALKSWDPITGETTYDASQYDTAKREWVREVHPSKSVIPTEWEAYKAFSEKLSYETHKSSGYITLSLELISPELARDWVTKLVDDINAKVKRDELAEIQRNIDYLTEQLEKTKLAEMQKVFYQLIEEQIKNQMLAQAQNEFVFKTIDPAIVPEEKAGPKRAVICILGAMVSGLLAMLIALANHHRKRRKKC